MTSKFPDKNKIDEIRVFLDIFPKEITKNIYSNEYLHDLLEVILDLGRKPEARYIDKTIALSKEVTREQIVSIISKIGKFGDDNRAGIERTLHRISVIKNNRVTVGLTIGRAVFGSVKLIEI